MKKLRRIAIEASLVCLLIPFSATDAANFIDAVVAFAPSTIEPDAAIFAAKLQIGMDLVLARPQMPGRKIRFRSHILPATFSSGTANTQSFGDLIE